MYNRKVSFAVIRGFYKVWGHKLLAPQVGRISGGDNMKITVWDEQLILHNHQNSGSFFPAVTGNFKT